MSTVTEETSEVAEVQATKWVYLFEEGPGDDKSLLGGKGAGLCEMTRAGLPVPPGLIVTTQACNALRVREEAGKLLSAITSQSPRVARSPKTASMTGSGRPTMSQSAKAVSGAFNMPTKRAGKP